MKRIISIILTFSMMLCLFSCTDGKDNREITVNGENASNTENQIESITKKIVTTIAEVVSDIQPTEKETEIAVSDPISAVQGGGLCQPQAAIRGTTDLAISLLKNTLDTPNAVISPVSVAIALTMAGSGAKDKTLDEFQKILGSSMSGMQGFVESYLNTVNSNPDLGINLANSVWFNAQKGRLNVNSRFEELCKNRFHADIFKEEFASATADRINKWISDKTDGKIEKVLEEIPDEAVAYLINTVLFEAEWAGNYTSRDVVPNFLFTTADGRKQSVTMLKSVEPVNDTVNFKLGKTEALIKDYKNGYKFVAMLPNEGVSIEKALESLDGQEFVNAVTKKNVNENGEFLVGIHPLIVYLPKFESECKFTLAETLKAMGMTKSFSSRDADFSDMATSSRGNIFINEVFHNTYIKLDEKGTKAAASTAVEMFDECASEPPETTKELRFDRPFIYVIVSPEGIPLFAGTVTDFEAG
ncbi:MAG: serpin family protein [Clostridia bacterium]|nr:serpin family protein [Clostridia bacterium]